MFGQRRFNSTQSYYPFSYSPTSKFNWGNLLTNAQKTVGIINQAIPIFYQLGPMYRNSKTMFKIFNEFNKVSSPSTAINNTNVLNNSINNNASNIINDSTPSFFI